MRFDRIVGAAGAMLLTLALIACDNPDLPGVAADSGPTDHAPPEPVPSTNEDPGPTALGEVTEATVDGGESPDVVEPFVAKGRITTRGGEPLPGIEVGASNTLIYNSHLYGVSNADGYYRIDLSGAPHTSWRMWGMVEVSYEGRTYREDLHVDTLSFASSEGAIRDFEWRLEGLRPGEDDYYYGGRGYVHEDWYDYPEDAQQIDDMSWVELTFEPTGPLIDGSRGETVVRQVRHYEFKGVPMGRYRISATYTPPGGGTVDLLIGDYGEDEPHHGPWVELVFDPDNSIGLSVRHPN